MATEEDPKYLPNNPSFCTRAVHAGFEPDRWTSKALVPPITLSTVYRQDEPHQKREFFYGRLDNPSRNAVEKSLASLEEADYAVTFGSGTAAIAAVVQLLKSGDHIVASQHLYSGTWTYFTAIAQRQGLKIDFVDLREPKNVLRVLKSNTKMVWVESPTNPTMDVIDLQQLASLVQQHNIQNKDGASTATKPSTEVLGKVLSKGTLLVVDNTFLSPYFQRPLSFGADIVVHSCTKYLNGSSDVIMGVVCTSCPQIQEQLVFLQSSAGAIPSPFDCYLLQRSLRTLPLRMEKHMRNGLGVARFLHNHPFVKKVLHPGLPSHPQHQLSLRQTHGHSGMVSFYLLEDDLEKARLFLKALRVVSLSSSLGGVESLAEQPLVMSHAGVPREENEAAGVTAGLIRFSVGLEDLPDIIQDLDQALSAAFGKPN